MSQDFLERFALAEDRAAALERLITGTDDSYYYRSLHAQHQRDFARAQENLKAWRSQIGDNHRANLTQDRIALACIDDHEAETLKYLREKLSPNLYHQREADRQAAVYPTALDQSLIARQRLIEDALRRNSNLTGIADAGLEALAELAADAIKDDSLNNKLLARIQRPDYPGLVSRLAQDLEYRYGDSFGNHPTDKLLTSRQLQELLERNPKLLNDHSFVGVMISRLAPNPDLNWRHESVDKRRYLDALERFVNTLSPSFNSLKAHVLYHRMDLDWTDGIVDRERLLAYLQLPRQTGYMRSDYLHEHRDHLANLGQGYSGITELDPIGDDEELVRALLAHQLAEADGVEPFDDYVSKRYLELLLAETKILNGAPDTERWHKLFNNPTGIRALDERVEIAFAPTNPRRFAADESVALEVDLKNVSSLVIKVFEINAFNYYLARGRSVSADLDLDGLVARNEHVFQYQDPPARRIRRRFDFPGLDGPGVYIVDFIGAGQSSRALIEKGRLRTIERIGAAGHVLTVLDDANEPAGEASIWLEGREFVSDEHGAITIPFSESGRSRPIVLKVGERCDIDTIVLKSEQYCFAASFAVERERLIERGAAELVIRPSLEVHGYPMPLQLLEDVQLTLTTATVTGGSSSQIVDGIELEEGKDFVHNFQVPEGLRSISAQLTARVRAASTGSYVDLSDQSSFAINGIDAEDAVDDVHLSCSQAGYILECLGKSGEPRPGLPVTFTLRHKDVTTTTSHTLQSDEAGRIMLGALERVLSVQASPPSGKRRTWTLPEDVSALPRTINAAAGETIRVPYFAQAPLLRSQVSFLEKRGGGFLRDAFDSVRLNSGFLEIDALPAGSFELRIKERDHFIDIEVTKGARLPGWAVSKSRFLEVRDPRRLHIPGLRVQGDQLEIAIANPGRNLRVHVFASRYLPNIDPAPSFFKIGPSEPRSRSLSVRAAHYQAGRELGDEVRYVLERKYAEPFAGLMLERSTLLLNPWSRRSTDADKEVLGGGGAFGGSASSADAFNSSAKPAPAVGGAAADPRAQLDFLEDCGKVLANLEPDEEGLIRVPLAELGGAQLVTVVAVRGPHSVARRLPLPRLELAPRDRRLILGLGPDAHFTEQRQRSPLDKGSALTIEDITTSDVEVYDRLDRVYRFFAGESGDAKLARFDFVSRWPELDDKQKRSKYSEFACHELNFFIAEKDPGFFAATVRPFLANKLHKTFMDHYLLDEDLSSYLRPWAYHRLNTAERILLGRSRGSERGAAKRHIKDHVDLLPRDIEGDQRLFNAAIESGALDAEDGLGLGSAKNAALEKSKEEAMGSLGRAERRRDSSPKKKMSKSRRSMSLAAPPPAPSASRAPGGPAMKSMISQLSEDRDAYGAESISFDEPMEKSMAFDEDDYEMEEEAIFDDVKRDIGRREEQAVFFRELDATKEWAENNYFELHPREQGPDLIPFNRFWRDYAAHDSGPFLSPNFVYATDSFAEMMFALAVLDLPFEPEKPEVKFEKLRMSLEAKSPLVVFHKEIKPAGEPQEDVPILVSQNYFRDNDRTQMVDGEWIDKYARGEFLTHVVYTCQVVLTNPTSATQKLDLLLQIPRGSLPVKNGFRTRGQHVVLGSYQTHALEYAFYFPSPGCFEHFPVQVSKNEALLVAAEAGALEVVTEPSTVDTESWAYISQNASTEELFDYLNRVNIDALDLEKMAWRMKDAEVFSRTIALLDARHVYSDTLWAYSIQHGHRDALRAFLEHHSFSRNLEPVFSSPVIDYDPVERGEYEHLEYSPLVNARAHKVGGERVVLNKRVTEQYAAFLRQLSYRPQPSSDDFLAAAYYLLLLDRFDEGLAFFDKVDPTKVDARIQLDYMSCVVAFIREQPGGARPIADRYLDYPVDRWRRRFAEVAAQLDELEGGVKEAPEEASREQRQSILTDKTPALDFEVQDGVVAIEYRNLEKARLNFYVMDIELLFTRQPFVKEQSSQFAFIAPNASLEVELPAGSERATVPLPEEFRSKNITIELLAGGLQRSAPHFAHDLAVQLTERYGQLRVIAKGDRQPLPRTYVKVYARFADGRERFFKDGYTDLRGRFDYASLNGGELGSVRRFAVLVMNPDKGAIIREAQPPSL